MGRKKRVYRYGERIGSVDGAFDNGNGNNAAGALDNGGDDVETIVEPTETIVNTTTNRRTIRRVIFPKR